MQTETTGSDGGDKVRSKKLEVRSMKYEAFKAEVVLKLEKI